mmetsp:Transcript_6556/g.19876  ORF Transcript_6556/g.19876 Transcript_6556/m.19876 type:complete len:360 (+) Transcript_6556:84-1163(+)
MGIWTVKSPDPTVSKHEQEEHMLSREETHVVELFRKAKESVVHILSLTKRELALDVQRSDATQGTGTGFVWDASGRVVTNFHVVSDAAQVRVRTSALPDGEYFTAQVVGFDHERDIAVLSLEKKEGCDFPPALPRLKGGKDLLVGQRVFAIGNPFGLEHTLTTGVISGVGREIVPRRSGRPMFNIIQTDAAINPGNSGGPLLNSAGAVIGMNSAIASPSGVFAGVGFAIPVTTLEQTVNEIIASGFVLRPALGVFFAPEALCRRLGIESGLLVLGTRKDGPAEKAGIRSTKRDINGKLHLGDIIMKMEDRKVDRIADVFRELDKRKVGDKVRVQLQREDKLVDVDVVLEALKDSPVAKL